MGSNLGLWDRWYSFLDPAGEPEAYGKSPSYRIAADALAECDTVEDWGCGKGWFRKYVDPDRYRGIDGSLSPFADEIVDLVDYRSDVDGILLRHVLEHDYRWEAILENACSSIRRRLVVVLFTPMSEEGTVEIAWNRDPGVPDLSFDLEDLRRVIESAGCEISSSRRLRSKRTQYEEETVLVVDRSGS